MNIIKRILHLINETDLTTPPKPKRTRKVSQNPRIKIEDDDPEPYWKKEQK